MEVSKAFNADGTVFNKWLQDTWISTCNRMDLNPYFPTYIKTNTKLLKNKKNKKLQMIAKIV